MSEWRLATFDSEAITTFVKPFFKLEDASESIFLSDNSSGCTGERPGYVRLSL